MKFGVSGDLICRLRSIAGVAVLVQAVMGLTAGAQTNSWIKPASGDWQEETSWSLGILPDSSQSVAITNSGEKTVTINTATTQNFPQSLTVNDLTVGAPNMLLLDNSGTDVPLRVLNGLVANNSTTVVPNAGKISNVGGVLLARFLEIDPWSAFAQTNGTTVLSEELRFSGFPPGQGGGSGKVFLSGGMFACSDVSYIGGGARMDILQTDGVFIVTNLFSFGDYEHYPFNSRGAQFDFSGGTLMASNVQLGAIWIIGSSAQAGRISNPGYFRMAGELRVGDANEQLGRFILMAPSTITFFGSNVVLNFANSSAEEWNSSIIISNWNGSLTGGGSVQLKFGDNSSGLTLAQLGYIRFKDPAGLPSGEYYAKILENGEVVPALKNYWIKPTDGKWEEPGYWSLGILPDSSQSAVINNAGSKTVEIDEATAQNNPQSLIVMALTVSGTNTLLLNAIGTNQHLRIVSDLILNNATLVNLNSAVTVGNLLFLWNGQFMQNGGSVSTENAGMLLDNHGTYYLTNGMFHSGSVRLGNGYAGHFHQYGGTAEMMELKLQSNFAGSSYHLNGGELNVADLLRITGYGDAFFHQAGTNRTFSLEVGPSTGPVNYFLNSGLLCTSNVLVSVGFAASAFTQTGGSHIVTNTLRLDGGGRYLSRIPATYFLSNGLLSARSIEVSGSVFDQSNGTASIAETLQLGSDILEFISTLFLRGGTLMSSNIAHGPTGADIVQSGGNLIVTNLFSFGGYYNAPFVPRFPQYDFSGGTLTASNITLAAEWIIGSSAQVGRITNPGYFKMAGTLTAGDINEQLGRFILASNATIDLGDGAAKLSFAPSGAEVWSNSVTLAVSNWNGATNGDGADQLIFGADNGGLTAGQLSQIRFINPVGFALGMYETRILETGEVVPATPPSMTFIQEGANLVLNWPEDWTLQISTNAAGPYFDIPGVISPYEHDMTTNSQAFFRLRR